MFEWERKRDCMRNKQHEWKQWKLQMGGCMSAVAGADAGAGEYVWYLYLLRIHYQTSTNH